MPIIPNGEQYRIGDEPEDQFQDGTVNLPEEDDGSSIDQSTGAKITVDDDGGVTIELNPSKTKKAKSDKHGVNLALELDDDALGVIAEEVLQGIDNDIQSRRDWEVAYDRGIELMGIKLKDASSEVSATGSISQVYHPLLIETTVRYQSNAMGELLPSAGPVKVMDYATDVTPERTQLADDFEKDFNHYLTTVAKEYYPDTDQLLFNQGWSGMAFKKVFECPIRKRPCSDLVLSPDLIVSNDVVDLETAQRVTHRTKMSRGLVRRLQRDKVYRKVDIGQAVEQPTIVETKVAEVQNIQISNKLPSDYMHTIYECYIELDIPDYDDGDGIPLPYVVTIDKDSRQVLSIYRNWQKGDEEFRAECPFVKYGMIPALGFYDLGFVHLLGNTTRTLTAILRMQLDAGQFSIFPGFLFSKQGGKQTNKDIRLSPGTGQEIDTGGMPINQVAMALPYPGPSSVLASISENVAADGMRLGMATEIQVGEGRADVPVGTTMALIEQATKVMGAVHKRNHVSQQREFEKLRKLFNKNPTALWKFAKSPKRKWEQAEEFNDLDLVPASDPNIPSHTHRLMQSNALVMLAQASPAAFNIRAVAEQALNAIGIKNTESLLAPLPPPGAPQPPPPPEIQLKMQDLDVKKQQMQLQAQQQATHDQARVQEMQMNMINDQKDRQSREKIETMQMLIEKDKHDAKLQVEHSKNVAGLISDHLKHDSKLNADHVQHINNISIDGHKHVSGILSDQYAQDKDIEMRKQELKNKPPKGIDGK